MTLCRIIAGKNKPNKIIEIIKDFHPVPDELKRFYLGPDPVLYEDTTGAIYTAELNEICYCDTNHITSNIGHFYKVPNEYIIMLGGAGYDR